MDRRHHRRRNAEQIEKILIPAPGVKIEKHGARCIARIRDMQATASQLPNQPGIYRAKSQAASVSELAGDWHMFKNPGNLAAGKVRVDQQARALLNKGFTTLRLQLLAKSGGPAVLPDDGIANGFAGRTVPNERSLALVGNADGSNIAWLS